MIFIWYGISRATMIRRWRFPKPDVAVGAGLTRRGAATTVPSVEFRRLGRSGLTISEIAYGNWLTHGSQVEEDAAHACVRAALDAGITTFDTADVYAATKAESVLGRALAGQRREGLEIFTKVYWPTGPGRNDRGLSRKHIIECCHASLRRLQTDYVDLYQAHRYDDDGPARGDDDGLRRPRPGRQGALHRRLASGGPRRSPPAPRSPASSASS